MKTIIASFAISAPSGSHFCIHINWGNIWIPLTSRSSFFCPLYPVSFSHNATKTVHIKMLSNEMHPRTKYFVCHKNESIRTIWVECPISTEESLQSLESIDSIQGSLTSLLDCKRWITEEEEDITNSCFNPWILGQQISTSQFEKNLMSLVSYDIRFVFPGFWAFHHFV